MSADTYSYKGDFETYPCSIDEWAEMLKKSRTVSSDTIKGVTVSTVFLGLDHNYSGEGPPLIFETLVFGGTLDQEMYRYSTVQQAREGHEKMLSRVRETEPEKIASRKDITIRLRE